MKSRANISQKLQVVVTHNMQENDFREMTLVVD